MHPFLERWADAALTTLGFFWMALWAFCLGYIISSLIQVFVTKQRIQRTVGTDGPRAVALATFFGFVSSSCSFAALSTSRALFQKGTGLVPALAFLLASTNLVVELGILIVIFLSWHFLLAEYLGGLLLIAVVWLIVRLTLPKDLEQRARQHADQQFPQQESDNPPDPKELATSKRGWQQVAQRYEAEWLMVWRDVTFGFTVAGVIAAFVPPAFFQSLFIGSASENGPELWQIALHTLIGPLAAFFTFIGSMGNIPLAAILFSSGVSFAGIIAFIFSDLVVFPVLRISAQYFGWRMAAYILLTFLVALASTAIILHAAFDLLGILPDPSAAKAQQTEPTERFAIDHTLALNTLFLAVSAALATAKRRLSTQNDDHDDRPRQDAKPQNAAASIARALASATKKPLTLLAALSLAWLAAGLAIALLRP